MLFHSCAVGGKADISPKGSLCFHEYTRDQSMLRSPQEAKLLARTNHKTRLWIAAGASPQT
jgi:hypothetical protein